MRQLRFQQYVMGHPGGVWTTGTLKDLLLAMPYLMTKGIPPLRILNDLLRNGQPNDLLPEGLPDGKVQYEAGMSGGCAWKPFEIDAEEYEELVLELLTDPEQSFRSKKVPSRITTFEEWELWLM